MANLAASDITTTLVNRRRNNGRSYFNVKLAFGDGVKTYPAGGVPVLPSTFGLPNVIESVKIYDSEISGYLWEYSAANSKLTAVQDPAAGPNPLAQVSGVAIAAQTLYAEVIGW